MKDTVDEKVIYNRQRNTEFSNGYVLGVAIYREYAKADKKMQATIKEVINGASENAKHGYKMDKGIMCGVRDAANERKARKGK